MRLNTERRRRQPSLPLLLPLLPLLALAQAVDCLFLHTSSAVIRGLRSPTDAKSSGGVKSLFGYRVAAVRDGSRLYMLVSDPTGYHPATNVTSGTVHMCRISASDFNTSGLMCSDSALPYDFDNPDGDSGGFAEFSQFGASLTTLPDGQFAVCAPGHNFLVAKFNHTATSGLCGYWSSASARPVWLQKFFPYEAFSKEERMFGNCLGGFQAALTNVSGVTRLTVSGPFCMLQRLAVASATPNDTSGLSMIAKVNLPNGFRNSYLGYSLASDLNSGTVFAASPVVQYDSRALLARIRPVHPPAADYVKVMIGRSFYDYLHRSFNYIGYASAVITTSLVYKKKALILGAPFHSEGSGSDGLNRGCVFALQLDGSDGAPIDAIDKVPTRYCSSEPGGRLGTSVIGIGDVNYDGSEDFAVGCPGCGINGTGAIYLFMGFPDFANPPGPLSPFEVVRAADISPQLAGFGWSLAVADDLDGNTVNELLTGAVTSRHAVLLPGRLLLDTVLSFRYVDSTVDEFEPNTPVHMFSQRISRPVIVSIVMKTKSGIDLKSYGFNLHVNLEELADTEQQMRFNFTLLDCPSSLTNGWCRLNRMAVSEENSVKFEAKFRLKPLLNVERHAPPGAMLRDLRLLLRWRMTDRELPPSAGGSRGLFPAVLYQRRVFPGYEDAFEATLYKFKTGVCDTNFGCSPNGNLRLRLVGESKLLLNSYNPVTVKLVVHKTSSDPYYGGAAIRLTPSQGVHVRDNVTLREVPIGPGSRNASAIYVRYWSDHKEVLLTEPFPDPPDIMTRRRSGQLNVTLRLNFDARMVSYRVGFQLVNLLGDIAGFGDYVTRDTQPMDNWATLEINFNTSASIRLFAATDELAVADARVSPSESRLLALTGTAAASVIGPGAQHTYQLLVATRPAAQVRGLGLTLRVPLVTSAGRLLLYFPKNTIASHITAGAGLVSQYLPGLPFTSDDADGFVENKDRECRPQESDLVPLLANPSLVLLESQHGVNVSSTAPIVARVRRSSDSGPDLQVWQSPEFQFLVKSTTQPQTTPPPSQSPPLEPESPEEVLPTFDCDKPELAPIAFRCITFHCSVRDFGRDGTQAVDRIFLHLHARLWSPTYFSKHLSRFNIRSRVSVVLPSGDLAFRHLDLAGNSTVEQTFLFLGVRPRMVDRIPWGYIILAIFIGIWLLLLLILLLWYCNFFRRKRYNEVPQNDTNEDDDFYR